MSIFDNNDSSKILQLNASAIPFRQGCRAISNASKNKKILTYGNIKSAKNQIGFSSSRKCKHCMQSIL